MKKQRYLPARESDRVTWFNNFDAKLGGYAALLGISITEVAMIVTMAKFYSYIIDLITMSRTYTQSLTAYKNTLSFAITGTFPGPLPGITPAAPPAVPGTAGVFTYVAGLVARIKASGNYTTDIGKSLGIIGEETVFVPDDFVPILNGKAMPGYVDLEFVKDHTDGMNIYSRLAGTTDWVFLALDTESPYHDTRPLSAKNPEVREYQCRGIQHDAEIGQYSKMVSVTFAG